MTLGGIMSPATQRQKALVVANARRSEVAALKRRLATENGALEDILRDPPEALHRMFIIDVVRLSRATRSNVKAMQRLGRLAVRDGVNLMIPLGQASTRTREWTIAHARWNWRGSYGPHVDVAA